LLRYTQNRRESAGHLLGQRGITHCHTRQTCDFIFCIPSWSRMEATEVIMSRAETEKAVRDVYSARLSNDLGRVRSYFLPDSCLVISGAPEASAVALKVAGRPNIDEVLTLLLQQWEWLEQDILRILIDGEHAAVQYQLKVRFKPTGDIVQTTICDLLTFQSGKLREVVQFVDTALAARLMGREGD
jgi:ketosteroid isomerase-like protein